MTAFAGISPTRIAMTNGLPDEDARDSCCSPPTRRSSWGWRRRRRSSTPFSNGRTGNPRALELIVAALIADPLLEPDRLARDLMAVPDVAAQLLGGVYERLDASALQIISMLAVVGSVVPIDILRAALPHVPALDACLRTLAEHEVIKYDRVNRRVRLDPFDAQYALRQLVEPAEVTRLHRVIAAAAEAIVEQGTLVGTEADTWVVAGVEHWLAAGEIPAAAAVLDAFQYRTLQPHGLYDQIARLRRQLIDRPGEPMSNRVGLLRILTLQGDFEGAHRLVTASDAIVRAKADRSLIDRWDMGVAIVERDRGDSSAALKRLQRLFGPNVDAGVRARSLAAAAQLARRRDQLDCSDRWLHHALAAFASIEQPTFLDRRTEGAVLHQLAMNARFQRRRAASREFLEARTRSRLRWSRAAGSPIARRCARRSPPTSSSWKRRRTSCCSRSPCTTRSADRWGAAATTAALAAVEADLGGYERATAQRDRGDGARARDRQHPWQGLVPAVHLTIDRRSGQPRSDARDLAVRGRDFLVGSGYRLYARRVDDALRLHDVVVGAADDSPTGNAVDRVLETCAAARHPRRRSDSSRRDSQPTWRRSRPVDERRVDARVRLTGAGRLAAAPVARRLGLGATATRAAYYEARHRPARAAAGARAGLRTARGRSSTRRSWGRSSAPRREPGRSAASSCHLPFLIDELEATSVILLPILHRGSARRKGRTGSPFAVADHRSARPGDERLRRGAADRSRMGGDGRRMPARRRSTRHDRSAGDRLDRLPLIAAAPASSTGGEPRRARS